MATTTTRREQAAAPAVTVENARIVRTHLGPEDHGIFSFMLTLEFDGFGQGFGGYALDAPPEKRGANGERRPTRYGMAMIAGLLEALHVETWEKLPGTHIRVRRRGHQIVAVGHIVRDSWFAPDEVFERWGRADEARDMEVGAGAGGGGGTA